MGPIDPELLLKTLGPLLDPSGGLKGPTEAKRMASLVNDASKHVAKCMYMQILSATTQQDALEMFISVGGWDTLHSWLQDMKDDVDGALLLELLRVYQRLPVTIELLKQNQAAKTIKQLSKAEDSRVKELATEIVESWMQKIKTKSGGEGEVKSKKKKSSRDKEKDRSDREREKDKDRSDRERDRNDREKDKESKSRDKSKSHHHHHHHHHHHNSRDRETSGDSVEEDSKEAASEDGAAQVVPDDGAPRPKTVKKFGSKFRSTGLFEEAILPVKKKTNESTNKQLPKRPTPEVKTEEVPEKRPRLTLSMSTLIRNSMAASNASATTTTTSPTIHSPTTPPSPAEIHRGIKLIPPKKPPAHEFQESSGFMDSLTRTASYGQVKRKRKLAAAGGKGSAPASTTTAASSTTSNSTSSTSTSASTATATSNSTASTQPAPLKMVPSFYRDTLETSEDTEPKKEEPGDNTNNTEKTSEEPMQTENGQEEASSEKKEGEEDDKGAEGEEEMETEGGEPRGLLTTGATRRRKAKKKVTWADDACIRQIRYFEMDETERVNVNRLKDFNQMKKEEQFNDRKTLESAKRLSNDNMQEHIPWRRPRLLELECLPVERGSQSLERAVQQQREQGVLQALFFSKDMLPDSPIEADVEEVERVEPKIIPLEDESASGEEFTYTYDDMYHQNTMPANNAAPPGSQDTGLSLPPDLAHLLAEYQHPPGPGFPPQQQQPALSSSISVSQAEHLLHLLMSGSLGIGDQQRHDMTERLRQVLEPFHQNSGGGQAMPPDGLQGGPGFHGGRPPTLGLLGNAPPGYQPLRPPGPRFPFPGGMEGGDEWGENMVGGPQGRGGMGRPGFPMRHRGPPPPHMIRGRGGPRPRGMGSRAVCRHFANMGACRFGNSCNFLHPGVNGPMP